jgi:hypothetical protein
MAKSCAYGCEFAPKIIGVEALLERAMKGGVALLWRLLDGGRMTFQFHKGLLTYLLKIRTLRHSRIGANDRFLDRCVSLRDGVAVKVVKAWRRTADSNG